MTERSYRRGGLEWKYARVGAVLLLAASVLAYLTYRVGLIFDIWQPQYELVALFPSVTGLSPDATVSVAGHRVGKVVDIELVPPHDRVADANVQVRLRLRTDIREQIRADSRARLRLVGLLGDRFVDIEPGSPGFPVLQPGDTVPSVPPVELEEHVLEPTARILEETRLVLDDLHAITGRLARGEGTLGRLLVDDALYVRLSAASTELTSLLREINRGEGTAARLIHDPALYDQLTRALARVDELGDQVLRGEGTLGRLLTDDELYERVTELLDSADDALAEAAEFLARATEAGGTVQRLLEDPMLYDQLLKLIIDVQYLIQQIREDPGQLRPRIRLF